MHERHIAVGRTARYFVLGPDDPSEVRDAWFVLHGYGQLAATFVRYFAALDDGTRLIVAPEALNRFYLGDVASKPAAERPVGATWMTREDRAHEIEDYVAYLDLLWGTLAERLPERAPLRLTVLGFSQGTATAARWVALGTARPAHLVLWGGLLPPDLPLEDVGSPLHRTSVRLVIGSRDAFVTDARLAGEEARLVRANLSYEVVRYEGGHAIKRDTLVDVARRLA